MSVVDTVNLDETSNVVGPSIRGYCRVCGTMADDLLSIYQNEIVQELHTKLTTYLPIKISTTDVFPVEICLDCTNGVQNWHLLYQSCLYADNKFREMLEYGVKQQQAEQLADKSHNSDTIKILDNQVLVKDEPSETRVNDTTVQVPLELKQEIDLMDYSVHEIDIKPTPECQLVSYTVQEIEENQSDNDSIVECFSAEPIEIDDSDDEETDLGEPSSSIVKEEVDLGVAVYGDGTSRIPPSRPSRQSLDIGKDDEEIDSSKSERYSSDKEVYYYIQDVNDDERRKELARQHSRDYRNRKRELLRKRLIEALQYDENTQNEQRELEKLKRRRELGRERSRRYREKKKRQLLQHDCSNDPRCTVPSPPRKVDTPSEYQYLIAVDLEAPIVID